MHRASANKLDSVTEQGQTLRDLCVYCGEQVDKFEFSWGKREKGGRVVHA